jgi:dTDP-4-amino-4,6-dideoxygalactose transaminase
MGSRPGYCERYSNVQAAIGLAALDHLVAWTDATRGNARAMSAALSAIPGVTVPQDPTDRVHVYYQYCVYVPDRDAFVRRAIRAGLDVEYHHMDVCSDIPLFDASRGEYPGARRTTAAVQLPVHADLSADRLSLVAGRARRALAGTARPLTPPPAQPRRV